MAPLLEALSRPKLDSLLNKCSGCLADATEVTVLVSSNETGFDSLSLNQAQLARYLADSRTSSLATHNDNNGHSTTTTIFFINGSTTNDDYHVHTNPAVMRLLHEQGQMSTRFLADFYGSLPWTVVPVSSLVSDSQTGIPETEVQYGLWTWEDVSTPSYIQFVVLDDAVTYFCVNFSDDLQRRITSTLQAGPALANTPLFLDVLVLDEVLASYRKSIDDCRGQLREIENETVKKSLQERARTLHELAVLWHVMNKDFEDLLQRIRHLRQLCDPDRPASAGRNGLASSETTQALQIMEDMSLFWSRRVRTYLDRTNIRINLMHHLALQQDNQLSQRISLSTTDLAKQTQRDGVSMSTLATITAVFLPGTFVCTVLSTAFFNFDGTSFQVSQWWWILPAIAIPLTAGVLSVWLLWFKTRASAKADELDASLRTIYDP